MITVLYKPVNIALYYTLYPLIVYKEKGVFFFTTDIAFCLKKDSNKILIIVRYFKEKYKDIDTLIKIKQFKEKYDKVVFFDDSDGADSLHSDILAEVDYYFKKQILKDKTSYLKMSYGRQLFSDYYHDKFGIVDSIPDNRIPAQESNHLDKLHYAWNLGTGIYPLTSYRIYKKWFEWLSTRIGLNQMQRIYRKASHTGKTNFQKKSINKIQCRFSYERYSNTIGFQRKILLKEAVDSICLKGEISRSEYHKEIQNVSVVCSPFGWGEICFRDFEAVLNGAVLLKPTMEHLDTFPNIYQPNKTYIPFDWNFDNFVEMCHRSVTNEFESSIIAQNAFDCYCSSFNNLDEHTEKFIDIITCVR